MSLYELFKIVNRDGIGWVILVYIVLQLVEISKIQINPISFITEWVGDKLNKNLSNKVDDIQTEVSCLESELNAHIEREKNFNRETARREILDFELSIRSGKNPSIEHFQRILGVIDWYEAKCIEEGDPNGVVVAASEHIKSKYKVALEGGMESE